MYDFRVEQMEEDIAEEKRRIELREAAVHVTNGLSRSAATKLAESNAIGRDEADRRDEVIRDENGHAVSHLDPELDEPKEGNKKQVEAIFQALCEKDGTSPR